LTRRVTSNVRFGQGRQIRKRACARSAAQRTSATIGAANRVSYSAMKEIAHRALQAFGRIPQMEKATD
jgi:hypothetical protein